MNTVAPVSVSRSNLRRKLFFFANPLLILTTLVSLSACSNSTPAASSTSTSNPASAPQASSASGPCALITQAEAETALGKGATINATHNPRTGMDECRLKPGNAPGIDEIIMLVHPATGWDEVKKQLMDKPAPGLGDDAFQNRAIGYNVRKGDKYVQVFGPVTNDNKANDKATHYIAERAASRL
jgi:hypothetical protein